MKKRFLLALLSLLGFSTHCSGQTYSGIWDLTGSNTLNSSKLSLDISPRKYFYESLGSVTIPEGVRLVSGTCVDANSGGISCILLGPAGESFKLVIDPDANGVLVYFKKDETTGENQQAIFNGLR
jgi:hypothetical protein